MYILASNIWFTKLIKQFFFWIDKIVFNFISTIYDVMISIARTSVFTQTDISQMADRIYKLLAIFMVFKVTLSLITYVVNPDDFSDKSKGVSKLGINIIISMALLILTPYIFSYAYQFQTIILEDNSLGVLIFGGNESNDSFFNTAGDKIAYTTMTPFFTPNTSIEELVECSTLIGDGGEFNKDCSGLTEEFTGNGDDENSLYALTKDNENFTEQTLKNYVAGVEKGSLGLMFREEMVAATYENEDKETEFIMDYKFIFSTVTGVVIILLLITFCMDIAVRSLKLAFLQLVAPIPIISYVDPKSGKDGLFKKWYEMCIKTFLSLFIRLIALYFAVFVISKVADLKLVDVVDGSYVKNGIISVFIIIGALMFAKQLPKMLEGLGIKLDGDGKFFLNPFKKFEEQAIGGKKLTKGLKNTAKGAAGMAMGGALGTLGALTGAGAMRGVTGAFGGMKAGLQGKKLGEIRKAQVEKNSKMRQSIADGSKFGGRISSGVRSYLGLPTGAYSDKNTLAQYDADIAKVEQRVEPLKRKQSVLKEIADTKGTAIKRAEQKIINEKAKDMFVDLQKGIQDQQAKVDFLKNNNGSAAEISAAEAKLNDITIENEKAYINRNLAAAEVRRNSNNLSDQATAAAGAQAAGKNYYGYKDASGKKYFVYQKADGSEATVEIDGKGFEIDSAITDIQENIEYLIGKDEIQEIKEERTKDGYTSDENFKSVTSFADISNLSDMAADESRLLEVGEEHVSNVKPSSTGSRRTAPRESVRNLNREKENLQQSKRDLQTSDLYKQHQADDSAVK